MANPTLTVTSTADGLVIYCPNPFISRYMDGINYAIYCDTDASKIPPTATPSAPTLTLTTNDWHRARFLYNGGTAGSVYHIVVVITDPDGNKITTDVLTAPAFPTVVSPVAAVVYNSLALIAGNDGASYLYDTTGGDGIKSGGSGLQYNPNTASPTQIQRGNIYSQFGSGYSNIAVITCLPWRDGSAVAGIDYFYNLWNEDQNGASVPVNAATAPFRIPNALGAVKPSTPDFMIFPGDSCVWIYVLGGNDNGAPVTQYEIFCSSDWSLGSIGTVSAAAGPWYKISQDGTGAALVNGTAYHIRLSAINVIGESDQGESSSSGDTGTPAAATALTVGGISFGNAADGKNALLQYSLSGGVPPYKATFYVGYGSGVTTKTAFKKYSNAFPGTSVLTAPNPNINGFVVVTDGAKATAQTDVLSFSVPGTYAPGDMTEYLEDWMENVDVLMIDRPSALRQAFFSGTPLGVSATMTDSTTMYLTLVEGRSQLCDLKVKMTIQGQTSAGAANKGYKIKITNKDTGNKMPVKFGDWPALTTFDLKSYGFTDDSFLRDTLSANLFRRIKRSRQTYPNTFGFPSTALGDFDAITDYYGESLMATDGFPVEIYFNGEYQGLYMWRTPVDASMYQMDDGVATNIIMKYDHSSGTGNGSIVNTIDWSQPLVPANWNMKSPNISGYDDQSQLATTAPTQYAAFKKFWDAGNAYQANPSDTTLAAFTAMLDKDSVIDYTLFSNAVYNSDGLDDNFMWISWDGNVWHPQAYDLDLTIGNSNSSTNPTAAEVWGNGNLVWGLCLNQWKAETNARWKYLRDNNIISIESMVEDVRRLSGIVGRDARQRSRAAWGDAGYTAQGSLNYLLTWYQQRLVAMDQVFGYAGKNVRVWM